MTKACRDVFPIFLCSTEHHADELGHGHTEMDEMLDHARAVREDQIRNYDVHEGNLDMQSTHDRELHRPRHDNEEHIGNVVRDSFFQACDVIFVSLAKQ